MNTSRRIVAFAALSLASATFAQQASAQELAGTWFSDRGLLELKQDGDGWACEYGSGKRMRIDSGARGLSFTATEGRLELEGDLELDDGGCRLTGVWTSQSGGEGVFRAWRHDPRCERGKAADIAGLWRSSWGLIEIEQQRSALSGGFGAQGWSKFDGEVAGRYAQLEYTSPFGKGSFHIDFDADGRHGFGWAEDARGKYPLLLQRLEGHAHDVAPKAGEVVAGVAGNRMVYWLRAPKGYRKGDELPLLVFLHGSNFCSRPYVESIGATDIGERCIVVGVDGERWEDSSKPDDPRQNYTYVNFMGRSTYQGYPNTHRESPALVAEVIEELRARLGTGRTFVGGHSQGGFLTWFFAMHYPELVDGVFPMSSGMTMQCEADVFDDAELKTAQRDVAIAVVHGRRDPTVPFAQGEGTFTRTREHGFPMLRLFDNNAGHGFSSLPWIDAVEWLLAITSDDPEVLEQHGQQALDDDRHRDAMAFARRLRTLDGGQKAGDRIAAEVDEYAEGDVERFRKALAEPGDGDWIDDFLTWRDDYEFADCAAPLMQSFARLRAEHDPRAAELKGEARKLFQQGKRDAGWQKYEELVETCWASASYRAVQGWLDER